MSVANLMSSTIANLNSSVGSRISENPLLLVLEVVELLLVVSVLRAVVVVDASGDVVSNDDSSVFSSSDRLSSF